MYTVFNDIIIKESIYLVVKFNQVVEILSHNLIFVKLHYLIM
jgi:hypothetical protein